MGVLLILHIRLSRRTIDLYIYFILTLSIYISNYFKIALNSLISDLKPACHKFFFNNWLGEIYTLFILNNWWFFISIPFISIVT